MLELPPLDPKCTLTVKNLFFPSRVSHAADNGFRLAVQASVFSGSIRPGLNFNSGPGRTTWASVLDPGFGLRRRMIAGL